MDHFEQVQPPTMTRLIAGPRACGLISRRVDPDDRRQQILEVTPAGTELLTSANAAKLRWLSALEPDRLGYSAVRTDGAVALQPPSTSISRPVRYALTSVLRNSTVSA